MFHIHISIDDGYIIVSYFHFLEIDNSQNTLLENLSYYRIFVLYIYICAKNIMFAIEHTRSTLQDKALTNSSNYISNVTV